MIQRCFQILDKVSSKKEQSIKDQNIQTWNDFLKADVIKGIAKEKKPFLDRQLIKAKQALNQQNATYFNEILPSMQTWRLYDHFKDRVVFLDIETQGVGAHADVVVVGLYDGINTKTMIKNINLDICALREELQQYKLIITFNGSSFDLPFIKKRYDVLPNVPHIDLRHLTAKLGISGGLKEIEKKLGIKRNPMVEKIAGGDPLLLWRMFKGSNDPYYLDLLIEYNEDDVYNLKKIMNVCYEELSSLS